MDWNTACEYHPLEYRPAVTRGGCNACSEKRTRSVEFFYFRHCEENEQCFRCNHRSSMSWTTSLRVPKSSCTRTLLSSHLRMYMTVAVRMINKIERMVYPNSCTVLFKRDWGGEGVGGNWLPKHTIVLSQGIMTTDSSLMVIVSISLSSAEKGLAWLWGSDVVE